jgi:DNA processing protein
MDTDTRRLRASLLLHSIPGLGQASLRRLLATQSAAAVLQQDEASWRAAGLPAALARMLARARNRGLGPDAVFDVERALDTVQALGVRVMELSDPDFPPLLSVIPDPPPLLYLRGRMEIIGSPQIAMVGSRRASPAGRRIASALAAELVERGAVVTSGLATGIDGACHRGAIDGGGNSIAVMATGIERIYPRQHRDMAERLLQQGLLVTEFAPGAPPQRDHFPRRNRIISGLSLATVVVEAALPSGSLLTATAAAAQGRDVCAVPWSSLHPGGAGCLQLLHDGAALVRNATDVMDSIGWFRPAPARPGGQGSHLSAGLSAAARELYDAIGFEAVTIEQLLRDLGCEPGGLQALLTELELQGLVTRTLDGIVRA